MLTGIPRLAFAALLLSAAGCDDPDTRNCPLERYQGSGTYLLEYELVIPADCPVPISSAHEKKRAGATVLDYGYSDFRYAEVYMENSDRRFLVSRVFQFVVAGSNSTHTAARPSTDYPAATGGYGGGLDRAHDYGQFWVTNSTNGHAGWEPFGEIKITYRQSALAARLDGPEIPSSNSVGTWKAAVQSGVAPYRYSWYRDGVQVSTDSLYSANVGTNSFSLRTEVIDATMSSVVAVMMVEVDGIRVVVDGADLVYTSEGAHTWSALTTGGYAPYTFNWSLDGQHVGTGSSYTTALPAGSHRLRVDIADSRGTTYGTNHFVSVIDNSCQGDICGAM